MKLGPPNSPSPETNHSDSFDFTPPTRPVLFSQPDEIADCAADSDGFNLSDVTDQLKWFHALPRQRALRFYQRPDSDGNKADAG